jgi:excisionase family DNA binding protein
VSVTPKFKELVRVATTQFRSLNQDKFLSAADKKQLKTFFLDRMIGPRVRDILTENRNGHGFPAPQSKERMAGQQLLTAREVEARLKIDVKTLYAFAKQRIIPHVRLRGNVRFPARELENWIRSHSHIPRALRYRRATRHNGAERRAPARAS